MNANEEMVAGNCDSDASYFDADPDAPYLNTGCADTDIRRVVWGNSAIFRTTMKNLSVSPSKMYYIVLLLS